ncbi:hypothetical protein [Streptomyces sp. NPDC051572]|uniref:hypothetical protein n=1 Tax=Streptomyces sp. NPDC051572 TaxID=3155802 RepID=UPI00344E28F9
MLVTQEHHRCPGTVADNLRLARRDASVSDLAAALAAVGASGWIDALPFGVDTLVGTGGVDLTPRQIQQLAQALDRAAALAAAEGRAAVVVAHRVSQAATADVVVVMDDGSVVERGTRRAAVGGRGATPVCGPPGHAAPSDRAPSPVPPGSAGPLRPRTDGCDLGAAYTP